MIATRRERNRNFLAKWEFITKTNSHYTPCARLTWYSEMNEAEGDASDDEISIEENVSFAKELARASLSNAELEEIARRFPPPAEWFDVDEERPF